MSINMGNVVLLALTELGVRIENSLETQESLTLYISVPEHSYRLNADDEEMSGKALAKRVKEVLADMGVKRLILKYKTRSGEYWTKEMSEQALLAVRKKLFGSQY
jgi:hypothetical protein